jgi:hypothetical protein
LLGFNHIVAINPQTPTAKIIKIILSGLFIVVSSLMATYF